MFVRLLWLCPAVAATALVFFSCSDDSESAPTGAGGTGAQSTTTTSNSTTSSTTPAGGGGAGGSTTGEGGTKATCGNGRVDSLEPCDGELFDDTLTSCEDNYLGAGQVACTAHCTLDFSGCDSTDYCAGLGFYDEGQCDACELMGGTPDPDCAAHCGADGTCADWYDSAVGVWSCEGAGYGPDPDCGSCGNGIAEGHEFCDGTAYTNIGGQVLDTCEVWSYAGGGTLACNADCTPDFTNCIP